MSENWKFWREKLTELGKQRNNKMPQKVVGRIFNTFDIKQGKKNTEKLVDKDIYS